MHLTLTRGRWGRYKALISQSLYSNDDPASKMKSSPILSLLLAWIPSLWVCFPTPVKSPSRANRTLTLRLWSYPRIISYSLALGDLFGASIFLVKFHTVQAVSKIVFSSQLDSPLYTRGKICDLRDKKLGQQIDWDRARSPGTSFSSLLRVSV